MDVRLVKKSGHKFFEFTDDGVSRTVCVDGWINANICPGFCNPSICYGWTGLSDDKYLSVREFADCYHVTLPTCFGYISTRGAYRKTGPYHTMLVLDKSGLNQYLYNYLGG